jgi:FkbM family methyltransferase
MLETIIQNIQNSNTSITGIIHVGGHYGQEIDIYSKFNIQNAYFFEPQKSVYDVLKQKCFEKKYKCFNVALGSQKQELEMFVEENNEGQSSSLLEPKMHLECHPDITFTKTEKVLVEILDNYEIKTANFLNIDTQGYELEVLKGSIKTLTNIDYIYIEINLKELYKNCPLLKDIVLFLNEQNFTLKRIKLWHPDYGDAFFVKDK